ncbi:MAG: hypothetical protein ACFE9T_03615 [Promethearchaeota archaeon]
MSEDEIEQDENIEPDEDIEEERKKLKDLGVGSTWNILTSGEKKKKESKEKPNFRGFK